MLGNFNTLAGQFQSCTVEKIRQDERIRKCEVCCTFPGHFNLTKNINFQLKLERCVSDDFNSAINELREDMENKIEDQNVKLAKLAAENSKLRLLLKNQKTNSSRNTKDPVYFHVGLSHHITSSTREILKFDVVRTQSDEHQYDTNTGTFVVKKPGTYYFMVSGLKYSSSRNGVNKTSGE